MVRLKAVFVWMPVWLLLLTLLAACTAGAVTPAQLPPALSLPPALEAAGPTIPFLEPNLRGVQQTHIQPLASTLEMVSCLNSGQTVYALTLQNTNVRVSPQVDACRVGRIPRGSLVRIDGSLLGATLPPTPASTPVAPPTTVNTDSTTGGVGYVEDIQPLFKRTCNTCHSAVAKNVGLQVTEYAPLLKGGDKGKVILPGNRDDSKLWQQVSKRKMPLIGKLSSAEIDMIGQWIADGAPERRKVVKQPPLPLPTPTNQANLTATSAVTDTLSVTEATSETTASLWLSVQREDVNLVQEACLAIIKPQEKNTRLLSSDLILPVSCGIAPRSTELQPILKKYGLELPKPPVVLNVAPAKGEAVTATTNVTPVAARPASPGNANVQASALGLSAPSDADGWLTPRGGFCVEQRLTDNQRGITALAFAPDGRLFMATDQSLTGDNVDPLILNDAYHPSRSVLVYDWVNNTRPVEIMTESSRVTGLEWNNGALYVSRAGEVGYIPDGGKYQTLAGGFAVKSLLFHANNGVTIVNGWLYVSAGGVRDGYSDGPIVGISEEGAQDVVSGGNTLAARIVRAPLASLISERSYKVFETLARGTRNPYGITHDPAGRLWFTDNGATNVPENVTAGDEVNMLDPASVAPGTPEVSTPYYGFPLALTGGQPWYTPPVVALVNNGAPTAITWAYGTLFFGQYGTNPGLYRLGRAGDGSIVAERIMLVWPLLGVTTAPDGALWIGTGSGGLFRLTPGCLTN